ncbi:hypothetical protein, partial [Stenotrophomonas sp.]|uniref:hypothetical protein n=1 Tax=Stenotrophomonas sp. TaxID=69392 RepID=UPI003C3EFA6B
TKRAGDLTGAFLFAQCAARRNIARKFSPIALLLPGANNGRNGACCRKSLHRSVHAGSAPAMHRLRAAYR